MTRCPCCDHPLQHAIRTALSATPYIGAAKALETLEHDLADWENNAP